MANGFGSFYVGNSGLQNAQNALNVTGNNLSNVETKGYVREQIRFAERNYVTRVNSTSHTNIQQNGLGVSIGDVAHARDLFLDKAYRQENGRQSFYENCYNIASFVEDLFQEMDGEEFKQSVADLWQAVQEFSKDPSDSTNQNLLLQKSELLISRSQSLYSDLQNYQANINEQIEDETKRMNEIGDRIYVINLEIQKIEACGVETAMTLRDERDLLVDELSGMGRVAVREDATGYLYVDFEDVAFVDEYRCYNIGLKADKGTGFYTPYWPQQSNINADEYVPVFNIDTEISTELNNDIGSIKALLIARGDTYGRYYDMEDGRYQHIEDCTVMETQAQVDYLLRNIVTSINDVFCPNATAMEILDMGDGDVILAYDEDGKEYKITEDTILLDVDNASVGTDGKLPPEEIFTRIGTERYTTVTGADGKNYYIFNDENANDSSTWYAMGSISINETLAQTITKMPAFTTNGAVSYEIGQKLCSVWEASEMFVNPDDTSPCNFEDYYDKIIGRLGTKGSVYYSNSETLRDTVASIENQRQQITGVSSDEELTHMIKFQAAYNAASRYINVVNQMTEVLVTMI